MPAATSVSTRSRVWQGMACSALIRRACSSSCRPWPSWAVMAAAPASGWLGETTARGSTRPGWSASPPISSRARFSSGRSFSGLATGSSTVSERRTRARLALPTGWPPLVPARPRRGMARAVSEGPRVAVTTIIASTLLSTCSSSRPARKPTNVAARVAATWGSDRDQRVRIWAPL